MSANTHAQHSVSFSLIAIFASAKMSKGISHDNAFKLILLASLSHSLLVAILTVNRKLAGTFNSNDSNNSAVSAAAYAVAH